MDPMTLSLLSTLPQTAIGLGQTIAGFTMKKPERPTMGVPASHMAALKNAEMQAKMTRLPGQSSIEGRLDRVTGNALSTLERTGDSPTSIINSASRAYGNQLDKETELGIKAAEMQLNNQGILRNEQHNIGNWENKAWEFNEKDPYLSKMAEISALKGAGLTNMAGGMQDMLGTMANFAFAKSLNPNNAATPGADSDMASGIASGVIDVAAPSMVGASAIKAGTTGNRNDPSFQLNRSPEQKRLMELLYLMPH